MAIQRKTSTPTTTRPETDLSAGFAAGAPQLNNREYTRKVQVLLTPAQYAALEKAVLDKGYPRHGGPSRVIREALGKEIGFEP